MAVHGETIHPVDPNWVKQSRWAGAGMLVAAMLCLAGVPFLTPSDSPLVLVAVAVFSGLIGVGCLNNVRTAPANAVRLNERGISMGDARLVEWREIDGLEERFHAQRVDLMSAGRERLGSIHYQVQEADFVIQTVVSRISVRPQIILPAEILRRRPWIPLLGAALLVLFALALALALASDSTRSGRWLGMALVFMCTWGAHRDLKGSLVQIGLHTRHLVLRTSLGSRDVARDDVREIALLLTPGHGGNRSLQVCLLTSDALHTIKLPDVSSFAIYRALRAWRDTDAPKSIGAS